MRIALLYTLFAAVATLVNIGSQALVWRLALPALGELPALALSVFVGTGTGLIVKYLLDKRWIFAFQAKNARSGVRAFVLYTMFSVVTTLIFWAFEFGAEWAFGGEVARYTGAVIGLALGYTAKYRFDKHITFSRSHARDADREDQP